METANVLMGDAGYRKRSDERANQCNVFARTRVGQARRYDQIEPQHGRYFPGWRSLRSSGQGHDLGRALWSARCDRVRGARFLAALTEACRLPPLAARDNRAGRPRGDLRDRDRTTQWRSSADAPGARAGFLFACRGTRRARQSAITERSVQDRGSFSVGSADVDRR